MQPSDETHRLLREIRDAQQAMLAEYQRMAARSTALQERAVEQQEQMARLYRRVVALGGAGVGALLVFVLYLALRVLRYLP
ncbi:MAG: hypothetical protein R3181_10615 [Rubricoccaceae bacterium]|nr:hypothetical protein [Rubricoccaceae bacterium]